jgi:hypothetical protein
MRKQFVEPMENGLLGTGTQSIFGVSFRPGMGSPESAPSKLVESLLLDEQSPRVVDAVEIVSMWLLR